MGFPCGSAGKESACNGGDLGSIPGLGRSPGEGKGYPFQYSGLIFQYSMDCIVHGVTKNQTQLSGFHLLESMYVLTAKIKLKMIDLTILKSYLRPFTFYQKLKYSISFTT